MVVVVVNNENDMDAFHKTLKNNNGLRELTITLCDALKLTVMKY